MVAASTRPLTADERAALAQLASHAAAVAASTRPLTADERAALAQLASHAAAVAASTRPLTADERAASVRLAFFVARAAELGVAELGAESVADVEVVLDQVEKECETAGRTVEGLAETSRTILNRLGRVTNGLRELAEFALGRFDEAGRQPSRPMPRPRPRESRPRSERRRSGGSRVTRAGPDDDSEPPGVGRRPAEAGRLGVPAVEAAVTSSDLRPVLQEILSRVGLIATAIDDGDIERAERLAVGLMADLLGVLVYVLPDDDEDDFAEDLRRRAGDRNGEAD